jgi:selenocysteine-specific translation elongation factor
MKVYELIQKLNDCNQYDEINIFVPFKFGTDSKLDLFSDELRIVPQGDGYVEIYSNATLTECNPIFKRLNKKPKLTPKEVAKINAKNQKAVDELFSKTIKRITGERTMKYLDKTADAIQNRVDDGQIVFYFLKEYELRGLEFETILEVDGRVEITFKEVGSDEGGNVGEEE